MVCFAKHVGMGPAIGRGRGGCRWKGQENRSLEWWDRARGCLKDGGRKGGEELNRDPCVTENRHKFGHVNVYCVIVARRAALTALGDVGVREGRRASRWAWAGVSAGVKAARNLRKAY